MFDVKNERVRRALADAPKIGDRLCDACRDHFAAVRRYLDAFGVGYELVPTLVRGLDYYTRTTFEFRAEAIGAQVTICGGGRYDGLIEAIGGPPTPGIGFGAGVERLLLSIEDRRAAAAEPIDAFFVVDDGAAAPGARRDRSSSARAASPRHRLRGPLEEGPADPGGSPRRPDDDRGRRPDGVHGGVRRGDEPTTLDESSLGSRR